MSDAQPLPYRLQDRYRLVEQIGSGASALVYRAHDETLTRDVAIKFLRNVTANEAEAQSVARFLREARAVARITHPNIVTLYDAGQERGWRYLVLELVSGSDLHTSMVARGGAYDTDTALAILRDILAALDYAHGQGLIHRDIKPQNVLLTTDHRAKLTDFGLARTQGDPRLTQDGAFVGTALYLAPEAFTGTDVDGRADLYAVGALVYELLTGQPPFMGDTVGAVITQHLNIAVIPPRTVNATIPPAIDSLILKLLAKNPAERFGSAQETLSALNAAVQPIYTDLSSSIQNAPAEQTQSSLASEVMLYAAREDAALLIEAERRKIAQRMEAWILGPLNMLLTQANAYEQTLGANQQARMVANVLASLTRQVVQQVRDISNTLNPTTLESLGLEPALEGLAAQVIRVHGLNATLELERLPERLPREMELAFFRAAQEALDRAVNHARATQIRLQLLRHENQIVFIFADNGSERTGLELLQTARERIRQLGGEFRANFGVDGTLGGLEMRIIFESAPAVRLTPRELEVLTLAARGMGNKAIAETLSLSPRTVNFHLDNVYSKLGVNTRTEAAIYALRRGWVRRPSETWQG